MARLMEKLDGVVARVKGEMIEEYKNKLMQETESLNIKPMQNTLDALEVLKYTNVRIKY